MLDKQIKILGENDFTKVSLELEISKFVKDCLLINLEKGNYDIGDIRKAHAWLRNEFKDEFKNFQEK